MKTVDSISRLPTAKNVLLSLRVKAALATNTLVNEDKKLFESDDPRLFILKPIFQKPQHW